MDIKDRVRGLLSTPKAVYALAQLATPTVQLWTGRVPERFNAFAESGLEEFAYNELGLAELLFQAISGWQWRGPERQIGASLLERTAELESVARGIATLPAAQWWWQPLLRNAQTWIADPGNSDPPRRDFQVDPSPYLSQMTTPTRALWTSSPVGALPAAWLFHGWEGFVDLPLVLWSLTVEDVAPVFEINEPADWAALCERYPADTTSHYGSSWRANWGVPAGPIVTPDWAAVARDWAGVHLTIAGLLTASSIPIPASAGHTLLEGWETESTVWFRWSFTRVERLADWRDPLPYGESPNPYSEESARRLHPD